MAGSGLAYPDLSTIADDVIDRARRVRLAAFDVDGTLTDGRLVYSSSGDELKFFHVADGLGLKLLRDHGIEVALITARESPLVQARARELGLRHLYQGSRDKLDSLSHLLRTLSLGEDQVAFMGDDLPDLPVLQRVGLSVAPANAHPWVAECVHWRTSLAGGNGAARELCDLLLAAQGHADAALKRFLPG